MNNRERIDTLAAGELLPKEELTALLAGYTEEERLYAAARARSMTDRIFGRRVYFRGIVELSS